MPLPLLLAALTVFAQPKPPIDSTAINHWPRLEGLPTISADGQYVAYTTREPPAAALTTIRATHGSWKKTYTGPARCRFPDTGQVALLTRQDTLHILRLGTDSDRVLSVSSFQLGGPLQWWMQLNPQYSAGGNWIFLTLPEQEKETKPPIADPAIWGYLDKTLRAARDNPVQPGPKLSQAVISRDGRHFRRLETLVTPPASITGDYAVIRTADHYALLSLSNGGLVPIGANANNFSFSPSGQWLVFYDVDQGQYLSCETRTGTLHILTNHLPHPVSSDHPHNIYPQAVAEPAGWLQGDSAVLLYDNWDLWAIDPAGKRRPTNLTRGYGFAHQTKLRLLTEGNGQSSRFSLHDTLWLTGFNLHNKYNGFFRLIPGAPPELLTMGPYTYYRVESQKPHRFSFDDGMPPQRSANGSTWIIKRESATEAPNYFLSTDLRQFEPLTQFAPQIDYNWLSSELIRYTQLDGHPGQGILYKPDNFDSTRRYPLIVNIYEQYSHRLYEFPQPGLTRDNLNIPWFVSRGYLVFTPDIEYQPANQSNKTTGQWAFNSVIAAVKRLSKIAYIDARHIGIQAHSLGAGELNYLITHTHCFAAAAEMAGPTDAVSDYLSLTPTGNEDSEDRENQQIWENGQARIGATLWQRPELYLRESAVLHADRITTPMLIVHNKPDGAVPWRQAMELYLALRRLHKPVWLLQYAQENHSLLSDKAAMDYTLRLTAFFDHYLKGQAAPDWMNPGD